MRRPLPRCRRVPNAGRATGAARALTWNRDPTSAAGGGLQSLRTDHSPAHVSILGTDSRQSLGRGSRTWSRLDFVAGGEVGRDRLILCWRGETLLAVLRGRPPAPPKTQAYSVVWGRCPRSRFHPGDLKDPREKPRGGLVPLGFPPLPRLPDPLERA